MMIKLFALAAITATAAPQRSDVSRAEVIVHILRGVRIDPGRSSADSSATVHTASVRVDGSRQAAYLVEFP